MFPFISNTWQVARQLVGSKRTSVFCKSKWDTELGRVGLDMQGSKIQYVCKPVHIHMYEYVHAQCS